MKKDFSMKKSLLLKLTTVSVPLFLSAFLLGACSNDGRTTDSEKFSKNNNPKAFVANKECNVSGKSDIVVLFTNDVHCGIDENIGYASLAAYKDSIKNLTENVILADAGDIIQGNYWGALSKGGFLIQLMNEVGYDVATFGNHEFDYGMNRLAELLDSSKTAFIVANFAYTGTGKNLFEQVKPYKIIEVSVDGNTIKIGFVGAITPDTYTTSNPKSFQEDGKKVYDLYGGKDNQRLVEVIQKNVDQVKRDGADFVILLAHLGIANGSKPFRSIDVIHGLTGVDVVLDGHSHSVIPQDTVWDAQEKVVLLASTGTKLANIGQMVISKNGAICTKLINDYSKKNPEVSASIEKLNKEFEDILNKVVAQSPATILASDSNSVSLARVTENGIGNLMTDAFRKRMKSDIAIVNGGNVRANIPKGNVTYRNLLEISPFENMIVMSRIKGAILLDALEHAYRMVKSDVNGNQVISKELETGSFLQTSGLKIVVDGSTETSIERDSAGNFKNVSGKRKVVDVQVEKNGKYIPLDTAAEYLVASVDYLLQNAGDGYSMFSDSNIVDDAGLTLVEIVADYLQGELKGKIPERYTKSEGRLTVK